MPESIDSILYEYQLCSKAPVRTLFAVMVSSSSAELMALYTVSNRSRTIFSDVVIHSSVQPAVRKYCSLCRGWGTGKTAMRVYRIINVQTRTHSNPIHLRKVGLAVVTIKSPFPHCERRLNGQRVLSVKRIGSKNLVDTVHGGDDSCDVRDAITREK
jgi:hypothetical protein